MVARHRLPRARPATLKRQRVALGPVLEVRILHDPVIPTLWVRTAVAWYRIAGTTECRPSQAYAPVFRPFMTRFMVRLVRVL